MLSWLKTKARSLWATVHEVVADAWALMRPKVRPFVREMVDVAAISLVKRLRAMSPTSAFGRLVVELAINGIAWAVARLEQLLDAMAHESTLSAMSAQQTVPFRA